MKPNGAAKSQQTYDWWVQPFSRVESPANENGCSGSLQTAAGVCLILSRYEYTSLHHLYHVYIYMSQHLTLGSRFTINCLLWLREALQAPFRWPCPTLNARILGKDSLYLFTFLGSFPEEQVCIRPACYSIIQWSHPSKMHHLETRCFCGESVVCFHRLLWPIPSWLFISNISNFWFERWL